MARQSAPGIPVLVTRPQAEAVAFANALTARFGTRVRPVVTPLLAPQNLAPELPDGEFAAVIFTSAQAVEAARVLLRRLPTLAWCVGSKTAQAARAAGFQAKSANGDAKDLIAALALDPPNGSILYLRGVDTSANILLQLENIGVRAEEATVYLQVAQPLTPEATAHLHAPGDIIVPLFSPRTARLFQDAVPGESRASLLVAAMSANVAEALGDLPHKALTIAHRPDAPAMLDAVETLLSGRTLP